MKSILACTIPTEGAPSFAVFEGWAARMPTPRAFNQIPDTVETPITRKTTNGRFPIDDFRGGPPIIFIFASQKPLT